MGGSVGEGGGMARMQTGLPSPSHKSFDKTPYPPPCQSESPVSPTTDNLKKTVATANEKALTQKMPTEAEMLLEEMNM